MQFGIFTVSDITPDPTTGRTPTEAERIKAMVAIAQKAEEVGLDVFATRRAPQPAVLLLLPHHDARLHRREDLDAAAVDGHDADHHQRPGEDRRGLRDAAAPGRRPGRPDDGPRQHRPGLPVVRQGHPRRHRARRRELRPAAPAVARGRRRTGRASSAPRCRASPPPRARWTASRRSSGTARSAARRSPSRPPTTATASSTTTSSGRRSTPSGWSSSTAAASSTTATAAPTRRSSASAGRCSCARTARTPCSEFRPYFDNAPVYGHGPSLEEFTAQTPLTVGSPQQVIERTLGFRDYVGDYQRQLFLIDHAGLPLKTVLEQLDLLGEEVVPVLRKEFAALKPAHVPDAPTHASLVAAAGGAQRRHRLRRRRRRHRAGPRGGGGLMTTRTLAVVSAGLSNPVVHPAAGRPADRRHRRGAARPRGRRHRRGRRAARARPRPRRQPGHRLPERAAAARRSTRSPAPTALIAVTPIFSASYSGLFKTFFDVLDKDALVGKPVLLGATAGTARHSLALEHALRPLFAYLRAVDRAHRGVRRLGGLGRRRRRRPRAGRPHRPGRRRARRPGHRPPGRRPAGRPVRRPGDVLRGAAPRAPEAPSWP